MSRTLQFKRLANTQLAQTTGANGEIIVDYTNDTLTVHDGVNPGGSKLSTETYVTGSVRANSAFIVANNYFIRVSPTTGLLQLRTGLVCTNSFSYIGRAQLDTLTANDFNMTIHTNSFTDHTGIRLEERGSLITYANDVYISTNVRSTGLNSNSNWRFSNTGNLIFPNGTSQNTAFREETVQNFQANNYVLQALDINKYVYYKSASNNIIYIPSDNVNDLFFNQIANGATITIVNKTSTSANVTLRPNTGVSLFLAGNTANNTRNVVTYGVATLFKAEANTWFISGTGVV
tara:strand:- start:132 stop:1001 length:870 start_codon:yes stop_codon:yes gene_type:complete